MSLLRYYIFFISALVAAMTCGGCRGRTTISDDVLARIFHDAFLSNAYVTTYSLKLDSLRLYEPIFNSYGYTTEDVQYTLGNFAMRKSARLGDVVESAISMLERRGVQLDKEVAILDRVDEIVKERADEIVLGDSLISVTKLEDTTRLQLAINHPRQGLYRMKLEYSISCPDVPAVFRMEWRSESLLTGEAADGGDSVLVRTTRTTQMRKAKSQKLESTLNVGDSIDRVVIELVKSKGVKSDPNIEIANLTIMREPSKEDASMEIFNRIVDINIFSDELLFAKDSL
ncbi:MAG: DUF4296 domain-containing protein [Rikenellaceae bacterium]